MVHFTMVIKYHKSTKMVSHIALQSKRARILHSQHWEEQNILTAPQLQLHSLIVTQGSGSGGEMETF